MYCNNEKNKNKGRKITKWALSRMLILITMKEIHQLLCPIERQLIDCGFKLISSINEVSYFQIKNYGSNSTYIKKQNQKLYIYIYGKD